jgi:Tol biopolymer transport system component
MKRLILLAAGMALIGIAQAGAPPPAPGFELALVDMQGQKKVLGLLPGTVFAPRVSPDGKRVAFEQLDPPAGPGEPELQRLYVAELDKVDNRKAMQVTITARRNTAPVWSPDGDWLAFLATGNGADALYYQRSDGGIQPKFLVDGRAVEGWYDDGKLVFITLTGNRDYGISMLDMNTRKVTRLIDYPGTEQHSSRISPDGKWIAYASNETGRQEVWLEPLPQTGKRVQLTRQGGRHPQWSPDGRQIYFDDQGGRLYRMDVTLGAEPRAGEPVVLPITGFQQGDLRRQYDLMPDGKAFVMLFPVPAGR